MTERELLHAMEHVREEYILRAAPTGKPAPRMWVRWASVAACLCLCAGAVFAALSWKEWEPIDSTISTVGSDVTSGTVHAAVSETLSVTSDREVNRTSTAFQIPFFVYRGCRYVIHDYTDYDRSLRGDYVNTAVATGFDTWSAETGYVELGGSVGGAFYTVEGFDPSFMLCMEDEDGIRIFVNDMWEPKTGADLYGTGWHLAETYTCVEAETAESKQHVRREAFVIGEEHRDVIDRFLAALYEGEVISEEDVPLREGDRNVWQRSVYWLEIYTESGIPVRLRLLEGGYIFYGGYSFIKIGVRVDKAIFEELIGILDACGEG